MTEPQSGRENETSLSESSRTKKLSLCMIVRNEEKFIAKCLESVFGTVDEIIVVDTGSTDGTKEICRGFGATVLDYTWNDDFAAARNYGLQHATGDWILWLDADEEVEPLDRHKLREVLQVEDMNFFAIRLLNFYGDTPNVDESFQIAHVRLFRHHQGIQFEGKIHERLNLHNVRRIVDIPVRVYHYGYMANVMAEKKKYERNIQLLENELKKEDYSPWIHYHIASEYFNVKQYEKAFEQVNASIVKFLWCGLQPPSLLYRLKYLILLNLGSIDGALSGIDKAIQMYPDYVDLHFFKGLLLFTKEEYLEAQRVFEHCIDIGEDNWEHLTMKGTGSFQAWYYKGQCLEKMNRLIEAEEAYRMSSTLSPTFSLANQALQGLEKRNQAQ